MFSYIYLLFIFPYSVKCLFMSLANLGEGLYVYFYSFVTFCIMDIASLLVICIKYTDIFFQFVTFLFPFFHGVFLNKCL